MHAVYNNRAYVLRIPFFIIIFGPLIFICMRTMKKNNTNPFSSEEEIWEYIIPRCAHTNEIQFLY